MLAGCAIPHDEPFYSDYSRVSGAAGTVQFVQWTRLRDCTWFECGEAGSQTLGTGVEAGLVSRGDDGALHWRSLVRLDCAAGDGLSCDSIGSRRPQLRLEDGELRITTGEGPPDGHTLAWSGMRDVELGEGTWLCLASTLPAAEDAQVVKIAPDAGLTGVGEVAYVLHRAPAEAGELAACASTAGFAPPRERPHEEPPRLYLTDVLRDASGRMQVTYIARRHEHDWDGTIALTARREGQGADASWEQVDEISPAMADADGIALSMPGFIDSNAGSLSLGFGNMDYRGGPEIRRYFRASRQVQVQHLH